MLLDQRHQLMVDLRKDQRTDFEAGSAKRLSRDDARRIGVVDEIGKETVQFRLDGALQTGQQEGQNGGKVEQAVARKELGLETGGLKKFARKQIVGEFV